MVPSLRIVTTDSPGTHLFLTLVECPLDRPRTAPTMPIELARGQIFGILQDLLEGQLGSLTPTNFHFPSLSHPVIQLPLGSHSRVCPSPLPPTSHSTKATVAFPQGSEHQVISLILDITLFRHLTTWTASTSGAQLLNHLPSCQSGGWTILNNTSGVPTTMNGGCHQPLVNFTLTPLTPRPPTTHLHLSLINLQCLLPSQGAGVKRVSTPFAQRPICLALNPPLMNGRLAKRPISPCSSYLPTHPLPG